MVAILLAEIVEKSAHFQRNIHKIEGSLPLKRKKKVATQ